MDTLLLILAWLLGLVSIWLGFPQSLFIGLFRGQLYRLEMSMNPILRMIWGGGIGCLSWYLTSFLWQWFFDYPVPLIFVTGAVIWSLIVNFVFGEWDKLVGLSKGNEVALLIGSFFFLGLSGFAEVHVIMPVRTEEKIINSSEEEAQINSGKFYVHGGNVTFKLSTLYDDGILVESDDRDILLELMKETLFELFEQAGYGHRPSEASERWRVFLEEDLVIITGVVTKADDEGFLFTLVYEFDNGIGRNIYTEIGDLISGEFPWERVLAAE